MPEMSGIDALTERALKAGAKLMYSRDGDSRNEIEPT
jgi:hypothetical protein